MAKAEAAEAQRLLSELLTRNRRKSYEFQDGDYRVRATVVRGETTKIDEAGLKKELGYRLFNKVTKRVIDNKKLQDAMADGTIDPMAVGKHVEVKENRPFIRISKSEVNPEDG